MTNLYTLYPAAVKALEGAQEKGIVPMRVTEQEVIAIILDQEIITWSTAKGSVSFDIDDIRAIGE